MVFIYYFTAYLIPYESSYSFECLSEWGMEFQNFAFIARKKRFRCVFNTFNHKRTQRRSNPIPLVKLSHDPAVRTLRVWSDMFHFLPCLKSVTLIRLTSLLLTQATWSMLVQVNRKRTHQTCCNRFSRRFSLQWVFGLTRHKTDDALMLDEFIETPTKRRICLFESTSCLKCPSVLACTVEMCRSLYKHPLSQPAVQKDFFVCFFPFAQEEMQLSFIMMCS